MNDVKDFLYTLDWGSVADWFSGTVTALGLLLSLYWNYVNSRTKIFISAHDVRFNFNGHYSTTGKILVRAYNKSDKPFIIDEVGFEISKINNKKIKKVRVPINPIQNLIHHKENVIATYSDADFNTNVKELTNSVNLVAHLDENVENELLLVPYIKGPTNKYFVGKTKLMINTKTFSINNGDYIWMDEQ